MIDANATRSLIMCYTYTIHYLKCDCDEQGRQTCGHGCRGLDIKYNEDLDQFLDDLCPDHRLNPPQPEDDDDVEEEEEDEEEEEVQGDVSQTANRDSLDHGERKDGRG